MIQNPIFESPDQQPREVVDLRWREATTSTGLVVGTSPSIMWFGEAVDPLPETDLLFPEFATAEIRTHHFFKPPGRARIGVASLPQALVSGRSLVGSSSQLYRLAPATPSYVDNYLGDNLPVGDRELANKTERFVPGASVLLTHWNSGTYGHWLLEGLPKLLQLRRLHDRLPPFHVLLPLSTPGFVAGWIDLVLPAARIEFYDDRTEYVRAETLLVPTVLFVANSHHFHPELASMVDDLLPSARGRNDAALFVSRVQPSDYRWMSNQEEIENIAVSAGLVLVQPETLPITEQVALFAGAGLIVGEFGSAMHNALFGPPGAWVLCLNWINGLQSRVTELKRQRVGYLLPSSGEAVTYTPGMAPQSYHIDPETFRACVAACLTRRR